MLLGFLSAMTIGMVWLIGWGIHAIAEGDKQEQQFANTFYAHCTNQGGTYSVGQYGYVCWKNDKILFQSGSSGDSNPKG